MSIIQSTGSYLEHLSIVNVNQLVNRLSFKTLVTIYKEEIHHEQLETLVSNNLSIIRIQECYSNTIMIRSR